MDNFYFDHARGKVVLDDGQELSLSDPSAFDIVSQGWLRSGWDAKYVYGFSWLGRPVIQLPEDLLRIQEVIFATDTDVIVETGVAHGGSLVFYASLFESMGRGQVIGVDIEVRPQNRVEIENHFLAHRISLVEGDSTDTSTFQQVHSLIPPNAKVMVILDSDHSYEHVLKELLLYSGLVSVKNYIVACDGIMQSLGNAPRTQPDWSWNNPVPAVRDFLESSHEFICEEPAVPFNEGSVSNRVTYWPNAFVRRLKVSSTT